MIVQSQAGGAGEREVVLSARGITVAFGSHVVLDNLDLIAGHDLNGLMRLMMKSALERMLNTELDVHLGRRPLPQPALAEAPPDERPPTSEPLPAGSAKRTPNRRNGKSPKTVQGDLGQLTIDTPRDRDGTFEPQLIPKHQRRVPGFDEKILALYAKGMTTRDIQQIVQELYGVEVSAFPSTR